MIGEFDDGMTSSAESESPRRAARTQQQQQPRYGIRQVDLMEIFRDSLTISRAPTPPKEDSRKKKSSSNVSKGGHPHGSNGYSPTKSLSHKIDDIFSEVTSEAARSGAKSAVKKAKKSADPPRQRSPVRRVTDPLPTPPHPQQQQQAGSIPPPPPPPPPLQQQQQEQSDDGVVSK